MFPASELRLSLQILVHAMVDQPTEVAVTHQEERGGVIRYRIQVAQNDRGKMIGANGRNARALRILLHAAGMRYGRTTALDIEGC